MPVATQQHETQLFEVALHLSRAHLAVLDDLDATAYSAEHGDVSSAVKDSMALGILLAQGHAGALIPDPPTEGGVVAAVRAGEDVPALDPATAPPMTVREMLQAAFTATEGLPPEVPGVSDLIIEISDLVHEARRLGY